MRRASSILIGLLVCVAIFGAYLNRAASQPAPSAAQQAAIVAHQTIEARHSRIAAEIADIKSGAIEPAAAWASEWAGQYYCGDGLGMNVTIAIAPNGGITYTWRGCLGLYEFNHGDIVETAPDSILVKFELPQEPGGYDFISERLYFVRWGESRFLVPRRSMLRLADWLNSGRAGFSPVAYMPCAGTPHRYRDVPVGSPVIPAELRTLVFSRPLDMTLIRVESTRDEVVGASTRLMQFDVTVDKGRLDGLHEAIQMSKPWDLAGSFTITRLDDHTAEARLTLVTSDEARAGRPAVGDILTLKAAGAAPAPQD